MSACRVAYRLGFVYANAHRGGGPAGDPPTQEKMAEKGGIFQQIAPAAHFVLKNFPRPVWTLDFGHIEGKNVFIICGGRANPNQAIF